MGILQRVGRFFVTVYRSCYDMEWYRTVRTLSRGQAIGYAAVFVFLVTVVWTLVVPVPAFRSGLAHFRSLVEEAVPSGTNFEVSDGRFSTDLPPATEMTRQDWAWVVDDTVEGTEPPLAFEGRVGVFVGRDAVFMRADDGVLRVSPWEGTDDVSLTKEELVETVDDWGGFAIGLAALVFGLLRYGLTLASVILFAAVGGLVTMLMARLWQVDLPYERWFTVGLYGVTLPSLAELGFGIMGRQLPFVFSVLFFMVMFAVIADERARPVRQASG